MSDAPSDPASQAFDLHPSRWRMMVASAVLRLPSTVRERLWSARRARARAHRRRLESTGDFTLSRPALHETDRQLATHLDFDEGFFVEAGANDGYTQSNTYWLEKARRRRGLLVEPVPSLFREAVLEREQSHVVNCALVPDDYPDERVRLLYGGLMTTVSGARGSGDRDEEWVRAAHAVVQEEPPHEFAVAARTLSSILDEIAAPEVDLLSLDIEGFEPQALAGLDLERHAPRFVLVEIREGASSRQEVTAALGTRYVEVEELSPHDALFRRR